MVLRDRRTLQSVVRYPRKHGAFEHRVAGEFRQIGKVDGLGGSVRQSRIPKIDFELAFLIWVGSPRILPAGVRKEQGRPTDLELAGRRGNLCLERFDAV